MGWDNVPVKSRHLREGLEKISDLKMDERSLLKRFLKERLVLVDLLAVLFGISSWISINGLWVELPVLVEHLPEGWSLPSYLSIIVQLANIGPLLYSCIRSPKSPTISLLLLSGVGASIALCLAWDKTHTIAGDKRSLGLFICVFLLSLVDCTSSVLFLPYMEVFRQVYLNSYLIGEGMSGFVPSLLALAQGVGGNPVCSNVTLENGTSVMQLVTGEPRFSVSQFFVFLAVMLCASLAAFLLLEHLPVVRRERLCESSRTSIGESDMDTSSYQFSDVGQQNGKDVEESPSSLSSPCKSPKPRNNYSLPLLMCIQGCVCFLSNGALPSIMTFSCMPYGNMVYHLSVTLNALSNPLMAFLAFFLPCTSQRFIMFFSSAGLGCSVLILATALLSPNTIPGSVGAEVVIAWVLAGALFSYSKVSIAGMCRRTGHLFHCGVVTQVGSALGALVMFLLVNQVELFQGYYVSCP